MTRSGAIPPIEEREVAVEERPGGVHAVCFLAVGCPCEILVATTDARAALEHAGPGVAEAWRVERKFSRYRPDSVVSAINASCGQPQAIDAETERLLDYAQNCHALSRGLFDITSGVLRQAWTFDGSERAPDAARIESARMRVGFARLQREAGSIAVPYGMEIDLGGIAKEYAVDRALELLTQSADRPAAHGFSVLVNFGGDLRANAAPGADPWQVGIEDVSPESEPAMVLELTRGALATSGDTHRFVRHAGQRYGHILDPRTGWPVRDAPRAVTVAASTCIEAGTWSTLAMLQGTGAEAFLNELGVRYWCLR
jgi:thiamine biosynthesis lipoprotein